MKKSVDAIIFLPFCEADYQMLIDTIESIRYYVEEDYHLIAVDDNSLSRLDLQLKQEIPEITVLRNPKRHGGRSGLYVTQALVCKFALEYFDFKVFIKMDTDALMVGPELISKSVKRFQLQPKLGILGSYKYRADGVRRNWYLWKVVFTYESSVLRRIVKKPVLWKRKGFYLCHTGPVIRRACLRLRYRLSGFSDGTTSRRTWP